MSFSFVGHLQGLYAQHLLCPLRQCGSTSSLWVLPKQALPTTCQESKGKMNRLVRKGHIGRYSGVPVVWRSTLASRLSFPAPAGELFVGPEWKVTAGLSQTINQRSGFSYLKTRGLHLSNWVTSQGSVFLF